MSDGMSQAEIDALLSGASSAPEPADDGGQMSQEMIDAMLAGGGAPEPDGDGGDTPAAEPQGGAPESQYGDSAVVDNPVGLLTNEEKDALGEIGNISMGTAATTLNKLLNKRVSITTPKVAVMTMRDISSQYPLPFVAVEVQYVEGLSGNNILFLREHDVEIITDLLMGGDGSNTGGELTELHLSAICEVMNQMVGSSATSISKFINSPINISPPIANRINLRDEAVGSISSDDPVVRTAFAMEIEGLINSEIMQIIPYEFAKDLLSKVLSTNLLMSGADMREASDLVESASAAPAPQPQSAPQPASQAQQPAPAPQPQQQPYPQQDPQYAPQPQYGAPPPYDPAYPPYPPQPQYGYPPPYAPAPPQRQAPPANVQPMQYSTFDDAAVPPGSVPENMELLMDVPLQVSVELGKSKKFIKEILDFNLGTIVVLDKLAGEPVDIVVNGKLIAKGEVVVIDDNYGARITDIISPSKRI